jgi:threonine/homoserine/homoserine lactone efflux protein
MHHRHAPECAARFDVPDPSICGPIGMTLSHWLLYLSVVLVATLSPGPAVLLSVSNSLARGARSSMFSTLGNISGLLLLSGGTMAGLGALLKTSVTFFIVLKLLGGGYLIWLGIRRWYVRDNLFAHVGEGAPLPPRSRRQLYVQGLLLSLTNPKAIVFYGALLPQFIDTARPLPLQFALLVGTNMLFSFIALMGYALLARATSRWFRQSRRITLFNRICGSLFVLLGMGLLRMRLS